MGTNLFSCFLFFFSLLSASTSKPISYSDHCASVVPESSQTAKNNFSIPRTVFSHYTGGNPILGNLSSDYFYDFEKYVTFRPQKVFKTSTGGVYKVEANLLFRTSNMYSRRQYYGSWSYSGNHLRRNKNLRFQLTGFWSEKSERLCMVGSAPWYSDEGERLNLEVVLKLKYAMNPTIQTSVISGTLESLSIPNDPNHFDSVSIWIIAETQSYKYKLASEEFANGCLGLTPSHDQLLDLRGSRFCSTLQGQTYTTFELENSSASDSLKNCAPFGLGTEFVPRCMSLNVVQCSEEEHKVRYLIRFGDEFCGYYQEFDPRTMMVGEGFWDQKRRQLCVVGCKLKNTSNPMANDQVGDCSFGLNLGYPARSNESGYFNRTMFKSYQDSAVGVSGLKYKYTEIERVKKLCKVETNRDEKGNRENYPEGNSYDMRFDMSVKDSGKRVAWGYVYPIFLSNSGGNLSMSYTISITKLPNPKLGSQVSSLLVSNISVIISAEGIYDEETGRLCMVGCRNLDPEFLKSSNKSMDCEILLKFQFPPINSKNSGAVSGSIESLRKSSDPLFFEHLNISSTAFYTEDAWNSIWRMDLEIAMVLISNTLAIIFLVLQLFYVKKNPQVLPLMSILMLVILILGHTIPLVLNFEAMFSRTHGSMHTRGRWVEANEVIMRAVTLLAFFLQFRLLQITLSSRRLGENQIGLWVAEKKTLFLSLPLYIAGILIVLLLNYKSTDSYYPLWGSIRSYGGLVLDGFLLPQILLNVFRISTEKALCGSFYMGTTLVRLLPHAYDLYRTQREFDGPYYIYADRSTDLYSTAWDIVISCGVVLLAVVLYLQQRFGGRCFLPRRFKEVAAYEKVPMAE
ncbi:hypothetical protein NMG60_11003428, partial [Bertholletia excelsa]